MDTDFRTGETYVNLREFFPGELNHKLSTYKLTTTGHLAWSTLEDYDDGYPLPVFKRGGRVLSAATRVGPVAPGATAWGGTTAWSLRSDNGELDFLANAETDAGLPLSPHPAFPPEQKLVAADSGGGMVMAGATIQLLNNQFVQDVHVWKFSSDGRALWVSPPIEVSEQANSGNEMEGLYASPVSCDVVLALDGDNIFSQDRPRVLMLSASGDVDQDGCTDQRDVGIVVNSVSFNDPAPFADMNCDGKVDANDVALVQARVGQCF